MRPDAPAPPTPDGGPPDPDLIDYDALPTFDTRAFLWTLGVCLGTPVLGMLVQSVVLLVLSPVLWIGALIYGAAAFPSGQRALGKAVLLGGLVSAVVGFSLCSGAFGLL